MIPAYYPLRDCSAIACVSFTEQVVDLLNEAQARSRLQHHKDEAGRFLLSGESLKYRRTMNDLGHLTRALGLLRTSSEASAA